MKTIQVPDLVASGDYEVIVSLSGGKDSVATSLSLREAGVKHRLVFADTGWEAKETYAHLDMLRGSLGPIDVVGVDGGMVAKIRHRAVFPARMQRWCTRELKINPLKKYHEAVEKETGRESICAVGVRALESEARSKLPAWEDDAEWGGWMWRPIIDWTVENVIEIHRRHGVPMNPLYHMGFDRVGCFPCIFARKEEIKLLAKHAPERVDEIRALEIEATAMRAQRNAEHRAAYEAEGGKPEAYKPRYTYAQASFFLGDTPEETQTMTIDRVVEWSRTERGGRQLSLLPQPPSGGCFRWGVCEPPPSEGGQHRD